MRRTDVGVAVLLAGALLTPPARAQQASTEDLQKQMQGIQESLKAVQKDLQEIKGLLRARPQAAAAPPAPPAEAIVSIEGSPFKGKKDARVTIVDFTDYQ